MLIVPYVCAEFRDKSGNILHRITPDMRGLMQEAPDIIRQDLLFRMLVEDGSIKTPEDAKKDRNLEQDPMRGATADGKEKPVKAEPATKSESAAKPGRTSRTEAKAAETETKK